MPHPHATPAVPVDNPALSSSPHAAHPDWPIEPGLTMLNHGSYGICPIPVRDAQRELRARMDADPVRFFKVELERLSDRAREAISGLVRAPASSIALVPNATFAVATVLHSLELEPGDEIVITDHEYNATTNELARIAARTGARVVTASIPIAGVTPQLVADRVMAACSERTKLVLVSHIASASALVFPVEEIVQSARARGIDVMVDGAHAPGQVPIDLETLRPTYYAASCHKWLCTPKGTGFFYADPARHTRIKPLALSCRVHETRADRPPFLCDFDYVGTNDYTANLVIPEAIEFLSSLMPGGIERLMRRNHDLIVRGARLAAERAGIEHGVPESMIGSMAGLVLPDNPAPDRPSVYDDPVWDALLERHKIQVPVWPLPGVADRVLRLSAQVYNSEPDFERLGDALRKELDLEKADAIPRSA